MDKTNWTEADFEVLGWHDNHVHGFSIREGEYGAGFLTLVFQRRSAAGKVLPNHALRRIGK